MEFLGFNGWRLLELTAREVVEAVGRKLPSFVGWSQNLYIVGDKGGRGQASIRKDSFDKYKVVK